MAIKNIFNNKATIGVSTAFLIGYGSLQAQVKINSKEIENLKPTKEQTAVVDQKVESLHGQFKDFHDDYREDQHILREELRNILKAVQ